MKINNVSLRSLGRFILKTLELQLFLTGCSLPFLIAWGLPFSIVSVISTPLFAPLFTLFLLCSIGIFTAYFLPLPVGVFVWGAEKAVHLWMAVLVRYDTRWLIGFIRPHAIVLIAFVVCMCAIMQYKQFMFSWQRIGALSISIFLFCMSLKAYEWLYTPCMVHIPCAHGTVTVLKGRGYTVLIDRGHLATKQISSSWIEYELLPTITRLTGSVAVTHVIVLQSSLRTLQALRMINQCSECTAMIMPAFVNRCAPRYYRELRALKAELVPGRLVMVGKKYAYTRRFSDGVSLNVMYVKKEIASGGTTSLLLSVKGTVGMVQ